MNELLDEATRRFVANHAGDDVSRLALQGARWPGVDMRLALDQIAGRLAARRKLPRWAAAEGIVYPTHLAMEQCSSDATARYKASIMPPGDTLVDLTGGLGVDCEAMAQRFAQVTYVERQERLCQLARHNFTILGAHNIRVVHAEAEEYLHSMAPVDAIYIDPSRRDHAGRRTHDIADCAPNVAELAHVLLAKTPTVMVKLSPMLDVSHTLEALPAVSDLHIVSTDGECKELLVLMHRSHSGPPRVHCVSDGNTFVINWGASAPPQPAWNEIWHEALCLYEPNPSMMKAGCFDHVAAHYGLAVVSRDSHLLMGCPRDGFPGRAFRVEAVSTLNKTRLRSVLAGLTQANVAVRNFPLRAAELARRLRMKDGGDTYLFGTTTATGQHIVLRCRKL